MLFSGPVYDRLKFVTQIVLPGFATLYFALAQIWALPYGEEVVGTTAAVVTFLGVVLGISTKQYNQSSKSVDGTMDILENPDATKVFSLNLDSDPAELENKDKVTFKVQKSDPPDH